MQPLVSVIIPTIRDDADLREAIRSVQEDGYDNLEVIVVWDGPEATMPTDRVERVTYVATGGVGTPGANNLGLETARGDYVARLDADDISLPGRFAAQVAALEANPDALLSVTNAKVVDAEGAAVGDYPRVRQSDLPWALLRSNALVHSTFMFRRNPLRYDTRCVRMQDYELAMRLAAQGPIAVVDDAYVAYRVHPHQSGRNVTAFWHYIPVVLGTRRMLARRLRRPVSQVPRDLVWFGAQYSNKLGLRDRYTALKGGGSGSRATEPRVLQSVSEGYSTDNPYIAQLVESTRAHTQVHYFTPKRLLLGRYDVFHVQWPELLVRSKGGGATWVKRAVVLLGLLRLRLTGTKVVQTLHNPRPHEPGGLLERALVRAIHRVTDTWILLTDDPSAEAPGRRVVVPHGHYRDWFDGMELPPDVKPVDFCFFGQVRPYKGVPALLDAFAAVDDPGASLRIAGSASDPDLRARIERAAAADPRVDAVLRRVPDPELAALVRSAVLVVLPYDDFYNSGAALLALSLDTPILVPENPVTRQLADEIGEDWVITYPGELTAGTLTTARERSRHRPEDARPALEGRDWESLAPSVMEAYR
ncbi:glycosyltransferase [Nocardioides cheoyonin]|uniref:glycosyltransferase n=1 Tax=Nocardioides cheoyonin TaxID=3156615 RepID=UPI0032B5E66A